jgi:flagellar motor component MotA
MSSDMAVALIAAVGGVITSSGLWAFVQRKTTNHTAHTRLLMGLAYDKIITVGMSYIQRGWVSKDEYEEYLKYLVEPYKDMGGNGVADRISSEVASLPFRTVKFSEIVVKEKNQ